MIDTETTHWARPRDLSTALQLVNAGYTPVGGSTLIMSEAFPTPRGRFVDLQGLVSDCRQDTSFGAMMTLTAFSASTKQEWPALSQAAAAIANPGVRKLATIGGTVCARLPTCDLAPALAAHGACVTSVDTGGTVRSQTFIEFWATGDTRRLVTSIDLPPGAPGSYRRVGQRRGPCPALACVAGVWRGGGIELWAGAVSTVPFPLTGTTPAQLHLLEDHRCSAKHRWHLLEVLSDDITSELLARSVRP